MGRSIAFWEADLVQEMRDHVFDRAFPRLAEELSHALGDEPLDPERIRVAARQELVHHDERTRFDSVTFSSGMTLCHTTVWTFVRRGREFEAIAPTLFEDFCYGLAPIPPDRDGMVQAVEVLIQMKRGRPIRGDATKGLRLRATEDGKSWRLTVPMPSATRARAARAPCRSSRGVATTWFSGR